MIVVKNGTEYIPTDRTIVTEFYSVIEPVYDKISPILIDLIESTKNSILIRHINTIEENRMILNKDPASLDIPRWEILGYDDIVGKRSFEKSIKSEFLAMWKNNDDRLYLLLTKYTPVIEKVNSAKYFFKKG